MSAHTAADSADALSATPDLDQVDADPIAPDDDGIDARHSSGPAWANLAVYAGYLLFALWILRPWWRDPGGVNPVDNSADPQFFEWALVHASRIFTHGENPFFSPQLNAPLGVNMMANTGLLGMTVPLAPVTLLFGPSFTMVLMLTLGITATASAWYYVLRRTLVTNRVAAIVGGAFAGFAPGMVNHLNAHPNLVAQFLIPFILWRALELRKPGNTLRNGAILGLLITWQAFLNEELLFLYALAALIMVLIYGAFRPAVLRAGAVPFLRGLAVAAAVAGVLLAYPLWYEFKGPQHYRGLPDWVLAYGTDLAEYTSFAKLSLVQTTPTLGHLPEQNTFFGWPLLLLLLAAVIWLWRRVEVRALAGTAVVFALLSLGATAYWHGTSFLTTAPWSWLNKLPLFDTVVPVRLGLITVPLVAVLLALCVDAAWRRPPPVSYAWLVLLTIALVPIFPRQLEVSPRAAVPEFFTSGDWHRYITGDASILSADTTVWNGGVDAMQWSDSTRQGYRVVGGYFLGPDPAGHGGYGGIGRPTGNLLGNVLWNGGVPQIGDAERAQAVADIAYWHTAIIVLAPGANHHDDLAATLTQLIGAGQQVDDVMLWDVRTLK